MATGSSIPVFLGVKTKTKRCVKQNYRQTNKYPEEYHPARENNRKYQGIILGDYRSMRDPETIIPALDQY